MRLKGSDIIGKNTFWMPGIVLGAEIRMMNKIAVVLALTTLVG